MFNVIEQESAFKIDFIVRKDTEFHINEFKRRRKEKVFGSEVWVVSIEDLIISKLKWIQDLKSDTQLKDIKNILSNPTVDMNYVKEWCEKLNLKTYSVFKNE